MREAFEAWSSGNVIRDGDGYLLRETKIAWAAWQAAVAWERAECAKVCESNHELIASSLDGYDIAAAIRARGEK